VKCFGKKCLFVCLALFLIFVFAFSFWVVNNSFSVSFEKNFVFSSFAEKQWDLPALLDEETAFTQKALSQNFYYLAEGGQMIAFVSADDQFVLKFFHFSKFTPSYGVQWLNGLGLCSLYCEKHTEKRKKKKQIAFEGLKLAFLNYRKQSGIIFLQLNPSKSLQEVTLFDPKGKKLVLSLEKVPYVLQRRVKPFDEALSELLHQKKWAQARLMIEKVFLFFKEGYDRGLSDLDLGIMHNIGFTKEGELIHFDVGKLSFQEKIKNFEEQNNKREIIKNKILR